MKYTENSALHCRRNFHCEILQSILVPVWMVSVWARTLWPDQDTAQGDVSAERESYILK